MQKRKISQNRESQNLELHVSRSMAYKQYDTENKCITKYMNMLPIFYQCAQYILAIKHYICWVMQHGIEQSKTCCELERIVSQIQAGAKGKKSLPEHFRTLFYTYIRKSSQYSQCCYQMATVLLEDQGNTEKKIKCETIILFVVQTDQ